MRRLIVIVVAIVPVVPIIVVIAVVVVGVEKTLVVPSELRLGLNSYRALLFFVLCNSSLCISLRFCKCEACEMLMFSGCFVENRSCFCFNGVPKNCSCKILCSNALFASLTLCSSEGGSFAV